MNDQEAREEILKIIESFSYPEIIKEKEENKQQEFVSTEEK